MDIFTKFKSTIKYRPVQRDNEVFQLHYRVTAVLLVACGAMIASKQHFGDPIDCINKDDVPEKLMETYCWIQGTFTLVSACNLTYSEGAAHPCIDTYIERSFSYSDKDQDKDRIFHSYYQWVYFALFFQAACFYAPYYTWKGFESKLLTTLASDLKSPVAKSEKNEKERQEHLTKLVKYFAEKRRHVIHTSYFRLFVCCEVANFVNVVSQMFIVNWFLGGNFTSYGWNSLVRAFSEPRDRATENDPMEVVFPKMTKCTFRRFGPSGDLVKYDALCILPLNILNEKIYVIMWFWFLILTFITGLWLIYRLLTILMPDVRVKIIRRRVSYLNNSSIIHLLNQMKIGDWFVLSMLCKNLDHNVYWILMNKLEFELAKNEKSKSETNKPNESAKLADSVSLDMQFEEEKKRPDFKAIGSNK